MKKISSLEDVTIDWLKDNNYDVYFFGLGFVQVKIDERRRFHFYHPDLPAFVESPHNHRYNFVSRVLRGSILNEVWEEAAHGVSDPNEVTETWISYASCQKDGIDVKVPPDYPAFIQKVGTFLVQEGSSYYINMNTFHTVLPDFGEPCVTYLKRGKPYSTFAKVLKLPGYSEECPFSKKIDNDKLWEIVEDCLR
jgi:hypothetical protein